MGLFRDIINNNPDTGPGNEQSEVILNSQSDKIYV